MDGRTYREGVSVMPDGNGNDITHIMSPEQYRSMMEAEPFDTADFEVSPPELPLSTERIGEAVERIQMQGGEPNFIPLEPYQQEWLSQTRNLTPNADRERERRNREFRRERSNVEIWIDWFIKEKPCKPMHDYALNRNEFISYADALNTAFYDIESGAGQVDNADMRIIMHREHLINIYRDMELHDEGRFTTTDRGALPSAIKYCGVRIIFTHNIPTGYIIIVNKRSLHPNDVVIVIDQYLNALIRLPNLRGYSPRTPS